jgi:succinate dehydrogenase / fumarate reductase cytochrome b subunit
MAPASPATVASPAASLGVNRKLLLTVFGVVPLGVYVVLHLWTNLTSLAGADAFDKALVASRSHPAFIVLEVLGLGVPLLVHTVVGLREIARSRPNNARNPYFGNLEYLLQRVAAIGILLFIGAHVWRARILPAQTDLGHETWAGMHEALSEPITFAVYALGLLGVSYHLANGLRTAAIRTGLVVSERAQKRMQLVAACVLIALLAMSGAALWGFRPFQQV